MSTTPPPRLGLTTARQAVVAVLAGLVITAVAGHLIRLTGGLPPLLPWTVPAVIALLAVATGVWSQVMRRRVEQRKVKGQEGLVAVAAAKSGILMGWAMAGAAAYYALRAVPVMAAAHPGQRVWVGGLTAVAAILLAVAAHVMERACVVDDDDDLS